MVPNTCHKHGCCKQEVPLLGVALSTTWVGVQVGVIPLEGAQHLSQTWLEFSSKL